MSSNIATIHDQTPARLGLTPSNITEAIELANLMSKSGIVPKDYQGNPGNIIVAIQWGAEIGLPPLQAMQNLAVINGRPSIWGDAAIALVRASGKLEYIRETDDGDTAICTVKRRGEPEEMRTFSTEDAKRAGLSGKQGPWAQYPRRMRQMRARSWALRDVFPDVLKGVAIAEEAQDMQPGMQPGMQPERAMGTATRVDEPAPKRTDGIKAKLAARKAAAEPPAPTLADVLAAIDAADSLDALKAVSAGDLADSDKAAARKAYKARHAALKADAEESPPLELEPSTMLDSLIAAARTTHGEEQRAEILDAARDLSEAERDQIVAAFPADGE